MNESLAAAQLATAADLLRYSLRERFNIYELACLLHGADPDEVSNSAWQHWRARYPEIATPQAFARTIEAAPEMVLGAIGSTIKTLMDATGSGMNSTVTIAAARGYAAVLGLALPPALAGASAPAAVPQAAPAVGEPAGLPDDPMQKRATLLAEFREAGGKRQGENGKSGTRGALTRVVEKSGIDKDTLGTMLDKAIEEKRSADAFAQLTAKR